MRVDVSYRALRTYQAANNVASIGTITDKSRLLPSEISHRVV